MNEQIATIDSEILGGTPVFTGTRIPIAVLFENLADELGLDEILDSYPHRFDNGIHGLHSGCDGFRDGKRGLH
uniref:DUF433 domain-containing protein n=1 Tax=Candidatus Kentrum eta TaxID=2126337 RepID=A0A450UYJ1_9GAMM|nr:MAG: Protein of unknown function (DUF433) [Candidatus Kentron sp. H]VFJ96687.1 MAG: Protein of unknown function (DUF433) [Candidatus Kentron sp. H]VFJ97624.1 MAG: Protein of unknown function (DUF433) [Candidatus Kentron sp. H]